MTAGPNGSGISSIGVNARLGKFASAGGSLDTHLHNFCECPHRLAAFANIIFNFDCLRGLEFRDSRLYRQVFIQRGGVAYHGGGFA